MNVITGEDDYLVGETGNKIVGDGVGLEVVDSMNATNAELQMKDLRATGVSLDTPPSYQDSKVSCQLRK